MNNFDHRRRILIAIEITKLDHRGRQRFVVAAQNRARDLQVRLAHRLGEAPNRPEIEHAQPRMMTHEIVAGMKIGVQHSKFENLPPRELVNLGATHSRSSASTAGPITSASG